MQRHHVYTAVFVAAGVYNIGWGLYAAADPQWFFRFSGLPQDDHPQIFMTLGMVLGLYGLLYLDVARRPEHGFPVAAVGLIGKVFGPAGWAWLYFSGQWPLATGAMLITNDLLWWVPFGWYLRDGWPYWRASFGTRPRPRTKATSPVAGMTRSPGPCPADAPGARVASQLRTRWEARPRQHPGYRGGPGVRAAHPPAAPGGGDATPAGSPPGGPGRPGG